MQGYDPHDLSGRAALITGCGFALWLLAMSVAVFGFYRTLEVSIRPSITAIGESQIPPPPRLQISPQGERAAFDAAQRARLESYAGGAHIRVPIERAIEYYVIHAGANR